MSSVYGQVAGICGRSAIASYAWELNDTAMIFLRLKFLCIPLVFFLLGFGLYGQGSTGIIKGYVYDEQGEGIFGAHVSIVGSAGGSVTDISGFFEIKDILSGIYVLRISYIGYTTLERELRVDSGVGEVLSFALALDVSLMEHVEVISERVMDNEASLLSLQRKSLSIMEGLSAVQMRKVGAGTVSDAASRITGITVEKGKYVYVRGLGDRYNRTFLNGASIPSLDPDRNATQLDVFPSHLLNNIIVHKSFSADLPGDFSGGYINIETQDIVESRQFRASFSTSYNGNTALSQGYLNYSSGWLDFFAAGKGHRRLPREIRGGVPSLGEASVSPIAASRLTRITHSFSSIPMAPTQDNALRMNHNFKASYGDRWLLAGRPMGFTASLTHARNFDSYREGSSGIYKPIGEESRALIPLYTLRDHSSTEDVQLGFLTGLSYRVRPTDKFSLVFMHNRHGRKSARQQTGRKPEDDPDLRYFTNGLWYSQRTFTVGQLFGRHEIGSRFSLHWIGSFSQAVIDQPDLRFFTYGSRDEDLYRIEPSTGQLPSHYDRAMRENLMDGRMHLSYALSARKKLRFGGGYEWTDRLFRESQYRYDDNFNGIVPDGDPNAYLENNVWRSDTQEGAYIVEDSEMANNYDASRAIASAYAMYEGQLWRNLSLSTGVRMERTEMHLASMDAAKPEGQLSLIDVLPSFQLAWYLQEKWVFRATYGRTVGRPSFRELAPYASFDFIGDYLLVGNASLQRTLTDNYELKGEWFYDTGELISLAGFYKRFHDPIERTFNTQSQGVELTYRNVERAEILGAELTMKKRLDFLHVGLRNLELGSNVAFIYSWVNVDAEELRIIRSYNSGASATRPMFGQSPYIVNMFLGYTHKDWEANISYNVFGKRISVVTRGGPNIYEQPRHALDLNVSKTFARWKLRAGISNLLNTKYVFSQEYEGRRYIYQSHQLGRTISIGATYDIAF